MLFQRKNRENLGNRIKLALWPRRSWIRSFRYYGKRALRLSGTHQAIALGLAVGAFASFTPFVGFHFVIAALLAFLLRANILASALGTAVGNPITFPFIWASTYHLGSFLLGYGSQSDLSFTFSSTITSYSLQAISEWFYNLLPVLLPMCIGALPLGGLAALLMYFISSTAIRSYQKRRTHTLKQSKDKIITPNRDAHDTL